MRNARIANSLFSSRLRYSGSWDGTVGICDLRASGNMDSGSSVVLPERVYSIAGTATRLVVACANRTIDVFDIRMMNSPLSRKESPLRSQTRKIRCLSGDEGFIVGSIEVRNELFL